jgi:hypothetical protein
VHQVGIMFAGKDVTSATHVSSELIHLVEAAIDDSATGALIAQVADDEVVSHCFREFVKFQVYAAHPEALAV